MIGGGRRINSSLTISHLMHFIATIVRKMAWNQQHSGGSPRANNTIVQNKRRNDDDDNVETVFRGPPPHTKQQITPLLNPGTLSSVTHNNQRNKYATCSMKWSAFLTIIARWGRLPDVESRIHVALAHKCTSFNEICKRWWLITSLGQKSCLILTNFKPYYEVW